MISLIVIHVCFLLQVFSFILFWYSMCKVCVCKYVGVFTRFDSKKIF